MISRMLCTAIAVLATTCAGCQEPAHAPTKHSQSATNPSSEPTTADSPTEKTPAVAPEGDPRSSEKDARTGLGVDANVGEDGVGVDVGEGGVNVDIGRDGVNVDVGDNGVGVDVGQGEVGVDVGGTPVGKTDAE